MAPSLKGERVLFLCPFHHNSFFCLLGLWRMTRNGAHIPQSVSAARPPQHWVSRRAIADLQSFLTPFPTMPASLGLWPSTGRTPCCPWAGSCGLQCARHGRDVGARRGLAETQLSMAAGGVRASGRPDSPAMGPAEGTPIPPLRPSPQRGNGAAPEALRP